MYIILVAPTEYEHTNPVDINRNAPPSPTTTTNVQPLKEPNTKESNTTHYCKYNMYTKINFCQINFIT